MRQRRSQPDTKEGAGGGGTRHQGAANGQAGRKKKARAHGEPRGGRKRKTQSTAPRPKAPGARNWRKRETTGARTRKKKTHKERSGGKEDRETQKGGGGNHQATTNSQAGNTKGARAHGGPRSARPTRQTTHSAKAQGSRGRKPKKAGDKGGARKTATEKKKRTKTGATPGRRRPSKAESQSGQRNR